MNVGKSAIAENLAQNRVILLLDSPNYYRQLYPIAQHSQNQSENGHHNIHT